MCVDWQCPFEDFVFPPSVSENVLKISVKVRKHVTPLELRIHCFQTVLQLTAQNV